MRQAKKSRNTSETAIRLNWAIDGEGKADINSGVGFFDHMLILMTKHGLFDLSLFCEGDLEVDQHHTVEDIGILLGQAFAEALGDKNGITRYASVTTPMDEALSTVSLDISGRPYLVYHVDGLKDKAGQFDTELVEEFFRGFTSHAKVTLHITLSYGHNTHHMIESIFKGFGRALDEATSIKGRIEGIPSTKGMI
ncbi:Imidazoleglycerol-phosphate dehydratase [Lentibacillus sp. JNUCC-1]|uniref:imidazoleglycerol-phosphate dehydratase HisB n=1 Tax=Lentibacillus sp. JNUCC-1 TaxID=2654513 RepID=UPI0012E72E23|nr:imidazoleglycerol-phosphate dehydratase HisB [Lentibacillus sp. JNUCC-1]MUV38619.1 Imidazoleglycerol-phosphate dehydratase [Lentibacillus sp. JNUCC-1]